MFKVKITEPTISTTWYEYSLKCLRSKRINTLFFTTNRWRTGTYSLKIILGYWSGTRWESIDHTDDYNWISKKECDRIMEVELIKTYLRFKDFRYKLWI